MTPITLSKPIKRGDGEITEIQLREPSGAGELRGLSLIDIQRYDTTALLVLTKRLSMTPLSDDEINRIGAPDLVRLGNVLVGFFQD